MHRLALNWKAYPRFIQLVIVEDFGVTVGRDMSGRTHEFDVFRVIEEIVDGKITSAPAIYLLGQSDIGNSFVNSQGFQIFSPVVSFISGEFLRSKRVDFFLVLKQRLELVAVCSISRGDSYFSDNARFFLHDNVGLITRPCGASFLPSPGVRIHRTEQFILGVLTPIGNRLFQ